MSPDLTLLRFSLSEWLSKEQQLFLVQSQLSDAMQVPWTPATGTGFWWLAVVSSAL